MPEEREINTASGVDEKFDFSTMSKEQMQALAVEVLDRRGVTASRFNVDLPPDVYGEWVPRDAFEVRRMQSMGFKVDKDFSKKNAIDGQSGPDGNVIADVIFMTCPRQWHEILDAEKHKRFVDFHGFKKGDIIAGTAEEKNFVGQNKTLEKFGIGTIETSKTTIAPAKDLFG